MLSRIPDPLSPPRQRHIRMYLHKRREEGIVWIPVVHPLRASNRSSIPPLRNTLFLSVLSPSMSRTQRLRAKQRLGLIIATGTANAIIATLNLSLFAVLNVVSCCHKVSAQLSVIHDMIMQQPNDLTLYEFHGSIRLLFTFVYFQTCTCTSMQTRFYLL